MNTNIFYQLGTEFKYPELLESDFSQVFTEIYFGYSAQTGYQKLFTIWQNGYKIPENKIVVKKSDLTVSIDDIFRPLIYFKLKDNILSGSLPFKIGYTSNPYLKLGVSQGGGGNSRYYFNAQLYFKKDVFTNTLFNYSGVLDLIFGFSNLGVRRLRVEYVQN
ncbi:MAG: hypothetical protein Q4A09_05350 [Capnocytophaga felis]|nr:hypothetical protein [Capnocytophaga felis]